jgi:hypothetical protein
MPQRRITSLAVALACASMSCAAILGFERLEVESSDAGPEPVEAATEDSGSDAAPSPCSELGVPNPPGDAGAGNVPPVLVALRLLDFGIDVDGGRPQIPGFNLDLTCSTDVASSSCVSNLRPTAFETHAKDKTANGLDNAGFSLIEYISRYSDLLRATVINQGISAGKYGAVIRIDGWNGLPDDDSVQVEVFPAVGFQGSADGGTTPSFDAKDLWGLDERFKLGGVLEASTIKSQRAWVTAGRLVGRIDDVTLPLFLDDDPKPFDIHLTDTVVSGLLVNDAAGKPVLRDGAFAGRWKTSDFLGQVRTIYLADSNGLVDTTLCDKVAAATLIYNTVRSSVCEARDLRSDSADNQNLPCDAVSVGMAIDTYNVEQLGEFITAFDGGARCADPAIPIGDDCP